MKKELLLIITIALLLVGCESHNDAKHEPSISGAIEDSSSWYSDQSRVVTEANISLGSAPSKTLCAPYDDPTGALRPCTLEDIENDNSAFDDYAPELSVIFSTPDFQPSSEATNAILKQKGKSTRQAPQNSYKVKLDSKDILYRKERRIQYNKQSFDLTRMRNKLSFDLFQEIPNFTSLKTEFVHLTLDGEDKGLYTRVESYDKEYLLNRGYHEDDNLYKAQDFWFYKHPSLALNSEGEPLDRVAFEKVIEPQRGKEQTKLLEMLTALEDEERDIDSIISQYFNRDNYLTWLAINIIMKNVDTTSQNFFLLNPLYSDTFYFLPWDYDGAWGWDQQLDQFDTPYYADWELGIARYWDSPLHRRFLSKKANRDALDAMIKNLRDNYITEANVDAKVAAYKRLLRPYITTSPDFENLPSGKNGRATEDDWDRESDALSAKIASNISEYEAQKGKPMPFWQDFRYEDGVMLLLWDESVDLEGDAVTYTIKLGDDYNLSAPLILEKIDIDENNSDLEISKYGEVSYSFKPDPAFQSGDKLYLKITSKDSLGNEQTSFDNVMDEDESNYFYHGVLEIVIP